MKRILVITTGGTISMKYAPTAGGAVPALKGDDFQALLPHDSVDLTFESLFVLPSSHLTPNDAMKLAQRIDAVLQDQNVDGVVVTHGTDTLEETAFLLDLTLKVTKPVVLTGSMHTVTSPSYDGVTNLVDAIRVAASLDARGAGVLVVFGNEIHAAQDVQKVHSQALQAFQSPNSGALGRVEAGTVRILHRPLHRQHIPCSRLEEMVDLHCLAQGADVRMLRHSVEDGVAGLVLEAFGSGRIPPWWLPQIGEALAQQTAVVLTSRCLAGSLGDEYGYVGAYHDLQRMGVLFAHNLNGPKARIKLMVALGAAQNKQELQVWFR